MGYKYLYKSSYDCIYFRYDCAATETGNDRKMHRHTVDKITQNFKRGLITEEERYKEVVETWKETDDELTEALLDRT